MYNMKMNVRWGLYGLGFRIWSEAGQGEVSTRERAAESSSARGCFAAKWRLSLVEGRQILRVSVGVYLFS